ncbi:MULTISPECIES: hypothetical protein [Photorhabdus]
MHHVQFIKDDASVYGLNNLRVVTPKRHIEIHKNGK